MNTLGHFHTTKNCKSKATGAVPQREGEPGTVWGVGQAEGNSLHEHVPTSISLLTLNTHREPTNRVEREGRAWTEQVMHVQQRAEDQLLLLISLLPGSAGLGSTHATPSPSAALPDQ